ncbi:MAG TPA: CBS domain-containing protein [Myxococcaceae bacterium]|nr:CBS domain-containing protein [Myxococcaceae bacterium]
MQVKDVMSQTVEMAVPDDTLQEAATRMRCWNVGILPVKEGDRLVGVITDRDIVMRAVCEAKDMKQTRVRDVMTQKVISCFADQSVEEAAELMKAEKVRRLMVLDRAQGIVGVVALQDIAQALEPRVGEVLERVSVQ